MWNDQKQTEKDVTFGKKGITGSEGHVHMAPASADSPVCLAWQAGSGGAWRFAGPAEPQEFKGCKGNWLVNGRTHRIPQNGGSHRGGTLKLSTETLYKLLADPRTAQV